MIKSIALLVLLVTASSLTTYTYVFSTTSNGVNQQPSYSLGFLNQTATLTVAMSFPFGGTSPGATLSIMDSLNANTIATLGNCGGTCTFTWTVTASATYYLKVLSSVSTQEFNSYAIYYLTASLSSTSVVLKVTDILRQHVAKMFYVQTGGAVNFTLYPVSDSSSYLSLLTFTYGGSGNPSVTSSVTLTPSSNNNGIATYTQNLTQGYYGIVVTSTASLSAKITTQTDTYACPYSKEYYDIGAVFPGCTSRTASPSGLPCTGYDYTNLVCYSCMSGYSLQGGTCVSTATCGSRQYVNLGICYNVSSTCDTFDAYLGTCLTCISSDYVLVSGSCILQSQFCSAGYKYINGICVSSTCGTYSQATGECFTCITQAYYLTSGKCLPVDCGANKYYSVNASACINVPTTCSSFSIITEKCISCNDGYYLFQGTCVVLPNTQNCKTYNFTSNTCAACNTGYNLVNGGCTPSVICGAGQTYVNGICILNPSSCTSNQVFLNNQCVDLPSNCLQINIYYQCTKCKDNYQIVAGVCQACTGSNANFPCVICPSGTYVNSNGVCQQANQYCGSFSTSTGVCLTCANGKDPVNGNCCDSGYSYKNGQCTQDSTSGNNNNSGTGNLRSIYGPYCLTINPEKKICTSCLEGHYADQTGYCV